MIRVKRTITSEKMNAPLTVKKGQEIHIVEKWKSIYIYKVTEPLTFTEFRLIEIEEDGVSKNALLLI